MEKHHGLNLQEVEEKKKTFGKNEIIVKKRYSAVSIIASQFFTFINAVLLTASFFAFIINDTLDAFFILAIILINAIFGFFQEYRAEKSLEKLKTYTSARSRVIRDGKETQVSTKDLVPGDLVVLSEGDRIPSDGKLTESHHVEIDESILTGESLPVFKDSGDSLFLGTLVTKGRGYFSVTEIGMKTKFGQIAESLATVTADKTPLQKQLKTLGKVISILAIGISLFLIPLGLMQGETLLPLLLLAVSIGIAAIPEGLPAVITIALALGTSRMAKQKAIVRKMPSIETLGAMQIVLVDKTGTLTQNTMRVKEVWTKNNTHKDLLKYACVLGNTASLIVKTESSAKEKPTDWDIVGDRTDGALLLWVKEQDPAIDEDLQKGKVIDEHVFDARTKTITTVFEKQGKRYVFVRGAPEAVLAKSKASAKEKKHIQSIIDKNAENGLRVIGFGSKIEMHDNLMNRDHLEENLTFLGIACLYDPPRKEAKDALIEAKKAGIKVLMVTGDNELTALAIAKEIGLIEKDEDVITGEEFEKLTDDQLYSIIEKTRIFARTRPEDKLRIVTLLKRQGYIVGVTGDGVNDALALKKADVGVAMGETGTDVAKEASDIVLADDNFATLVHAIEEGRTIYHNIVKAITYLLSGNLAEISLVFGASILGLPAPLVPTQILWMNLVTDGLPALALASDTKHPDILKQAPRDPKIPILTQKRMGIIAIIGFGIAIFLLVAYQILLSFQNEAVSKTIIFNALIFLHLMIVFVVRGQSPLRANKFLYISIILTLLVQALITTTPFFQNIFHLGLR
ncbi:MAG: cation-translocating P-type ATPase [Candidatus Levybacteria bacterium]|nr:cation-translocating P-type ATPase [Candidatus Levybacteria bacterium]